MIGNIGRDSNMRIENIISELIKHKIIPSGQTEYEKLKGGTVSELYLLNFDGCKYVVKINESALIQSESIFLDYYKGVALLPKLLYVEPSHKYLVYLFLEGSTNFSRNNKKELIRTLAKGVFNHYKPAPKEIGWGWSDQPVDSWQHFLFDEISEAKKRIASRLGSDDYQFVHNLVAIIRTDSHPYLLHGDCGVHNFLFDGGELSGVIDPTPVIGDLFYDLLYAFCSSPDDLTKETLDAGVRELVYNRDYSSFLYEHVIICLYLRIGTCVKHHPSDFEEYFKAWNYWKDVVKRGLSK